MWTGSSVVDTNNTAGFGAGAVVALATQPTDGDAFQQEQYLWYSTDGGNTFTPYGPPVITNDESTNWFRDPKIVWDADHSTWVAVIGKQQKAVFYTSTDLKHWTYRSTFAYTNPNIGGFECPDLFRMKADDGSWHWVLGASMQGDYTGKPDTYAYWPGSWNGASYTADQTDPQWLDWGWDWYAAVTWPDTANPDTVRHAIGWMNNWNYAPHPIKTDVSDTYNGQMSVVRDLTLKAEGSGNYSLLSQPSVGLDGITSHTWSVPTQSVDGQLVLPYHGAAYELDTDVSWATANNVGVAVGLSADLDHKTNIGYYQGNLYVDRTASDFTAHAFGSLKQSQAPIGTGRTSMHLRILVDRSSVEVFADDGRTVLSNQVMFDPNDTGVMLYSAGGSASFANTTIREFEDIKTAANPNSPFQDFEGSGYGSWTTTGTAFGSGPASGTLAGQQPVSGYEGSKLATSFNGGDTATGTLTSPSFTIGKDYINALVGGGDHPRPSDLFAGFEGSGWGPGWTASGDLAGRGPSADSLPNQVGSKVLDTYAGADTATGAVRSPEFTITRDYLDFLVAGGKHPYFGPGATAVNLVVDNAVVRTATGNDSSTMAPVSWDVHDLVGRTAHLEIVDHATGAWGHLMVDQVLFSSVPSAVLGEPDNQTTLNLVVDGKVVRTTAGQDAEHLSWTSWDVRDLEGQTAQLQVVDNNTGSWGHVAVDQVTFSDRPAS
ncbi:hypothetical protein GCM10009798_13590 [Nocardioides panacihumi]|uniref:Glycoside hydrolase family 32 protein n=1 Tax=Nocardioides panacihumi TaxID=400774 RepID=A0ABP5C020_9ACTN